MAEILPNATMRAAIALAVILRAEDGITTMELGVELAKLGVDISNHAGRRAGVVSSVTRSLVRNGWVKKLTEPGDSGWMRYRWVRTKKGSKALLSLTAALMGLGEQNG